MKQQEFLSLGQFAFFHGRPCRAGRNAAVHENALAGDIFAGVGSKEYDCAVEIVRLAGRKLQAAFGDIWVEGELSNLRIPGSGHCYFSLKDRRAQLQVVMFRSAAARLSFRLEDGQQLRCRGRLGIYDAQGRFQLTAETAEPVGVGSLQLAFEQLKRRLEQEGLFDEAHKRPLPPLPRAIAVVTSPTGAALQDVLQDRKSTRLNSSHYS